MRFATWNVNSIRARADRVAAWLEQSDVDVLAMQEIKCKPEQFPTAPFAALGYEVAAHGLDQWNGVAIASRIGLDDVELQFAGQPGFAKTGDPRVEARAIGATCGDTHVWSVYVPNGRALDDPHLQYKLEWLAALRECARVELAAGRPLAICGDFNIAPTDSDVWDPAEFVGSTHVSAPERRALQEILSLGLTDLQPRALKGEPFTYWDYRAGNFHKGFGMRIDLLLVDPQLAQGVMDIYIDRDARKGTKPSDHAPVVADLGTPR